MKTFSSILMALLVLVLPAAGVVWTGPNNGSGGGGGGSGISAATALAMIQTNIANVYTNIEVTISSMGIQNGLSTITNAGLMFGPDTPGTVTSGIQEAWNSVYKGNQYGPGAVGIGMRFGPGYFFYTNVITISNNFTTAIRLQGNTLLDSKLVYAGTATATNCFTVRGGGNPNPTPGGDTLDLPMHVVIRDLGFSAILENTNTLLRITNTSYVMIDSANFTSWNIMTNATWGSAVSINGGTLYPNNQGLTGLAVGNVNDHACWVNNTFYAGLATAAHFYTDHLYVDGMKTAFIGLNGTGSPANLFLDTDPRSLGSAILRRPGLDSTYRNVHFYVVNCGLAYLNGSSPSTDVQLFENVVIEGCDHPFAAIYPNAAVIRKNRPGTGGEDIDAWRITNAPPYSFVNVSDNVVQHAVYANGDGSVPVLDVPYDATSWNGSNAAPSMNAVRDKIESLSSGTSLWNTNAATGEIYNTNIVGGVVVTNYVAVTNAANPNAYVNVGKTAGMLRVGNNGVNTMIDSNTITTGTVTLPAGTRTAPVLLFNNNASTALYYNANAGGPSAVGAFGAGGNLTVGAGSLFFNTVNDFSGRFDKALWVNGAGRIGTTNIEAHTSIATNGFSSRSNVFTLMPTNTATANQVVIATGTDGSTVHTKYGDTPDISGIKYYKALLTVDVAGTITSVNVLKNTTGGTINWSTSATGQYDATSTVSGVFPRAKTLFFVGDPNTQYPVTTEDNATIEWDTDDGFLVYLYDGTTPIHGVNYLPISIEVYP